MEYALWLVAAYMTGSIPSSYIAGLLAGIDLREHGSKNLGATNVYRVLGWRYAIPVGIADVAKGVIPVLFYAPRAGADAWVPVTVGVAAVVGHVFSVFVRFRGGKGVATAAGAVLGLAPAALGLSAVVWLAALVATGYVSLASMLGAVAFPIAVWMIDPEDLYSLGLGLFLAGFILVTHRSNIARLVAGTENRFGRGRTAG